MKALPRPGRQPHPPIFIGSAGKRMLTLAARQADIIAPALRMGARGVDPTDATMEEKIGWIRAAAGAGARFSELELAQVAFDIALTDSAAEAIAPPGTPPGVAAAMKKMSTAQAVEYLLERRERYGFSYIQVFEGQQENFAPVVARLSGK